jgi:hypothetical protein
MTINVFIRKYLWFVVLIGIAIYLYFFHFSSGTIDPSSKKFAIVDTSKVTSISISRDSTIISLNKTSRGWIFNNGISTRENSVEALMNVLISIDAGSPLPRAITDSLSSVIESEGIKVEIYCGEDLEKSYSVLFTSKFNIGAIGKLTTSSKGFMLHIPGFKGDIISLFVLDPDYWKSNKLFIAEINQIASIGVEIPNNPEKSFLVSLDENGIQLKSTYFDKNIEGFDKVAVENFIMGLTNLTFERFLSKTSPEERAAILLSQPEQIFTITLTNSKKLVLKTYPIPVDEYRDEFGRTIKFDLNRLYISFNNDAILAVATYMVFDPVLKDISSFRLK